MKRQISDTLNLLWYQYNDQEFCDITVHCNDGRRYCNSFILLTFGEFWTEVISDSYTGDSNIHVTIPDVNVQTFDYLVEIILNGEVSVPIREANSLQTVKRLFQMSICGSCISQVIKNIMGYRIMVMVFV